MSPRGADAEPRLFDWPGGLSWLACPDEPELRASHALATDSGVWLVDPLDGPGIDDAIAELGEVAGVVLLLDRHVRDAGVFADRYDVAVHLPAPLTRADADADGPVEPFTGEFADTGYRARPVVDNRFWREAALVSDDGATALVPEALGTNPFYRAPGERAGVNPFLRFFPPRRQLGDLDPDRLLVGHGEPILEDAGRAVQDALAGARRNLMQAWWGAFWEFVRA